MPRGNNLFDLIEEWEPKLQAAFIESIYRLRDTVQIGILTELIRAGRIEEAISTIGLDPSVFRPYDRAIAEAFEEGAEATIKKIPPLMDPETGAKVLISFDARNPEAEGWLRESSGTRIREILEDQRTAIRTHLVAGLEAGLNPRDVALDLSGRIDPSTGRRKGGIIGLTASQEEWVRSYARELEELDPGALSRSLRDARYDRTIQRAIDNTIPLSSDQRRRMVEAYKNRALRFRAELIARTEALSSLHVAQYQAFKQAIDKGSVDQTTVVKIWRSAHDNRVRDTHRDLDGESVGFNETFTSSKGNTLRFPGDPEAPAEEIIQCRCYLEMNIDFLRSLEEAGKRARELAAKRKKAKEQIEEILPSELF